MDFFLSGSIFAFGGLPSALLGEAPIAFCLPTRDETALGADAAACSRTTRRFGCLEVSFRFSRALSSTRASGLGFFADILLIVERCCFVGIGLADGL